MQGLHGQAQPRSRVWIQGGCLTQMVLIGCGSLIREDATVQVVGEGPTVGQVHRY